MLAAALLATVCCSRSNPAVPGLDGKLVSPLARHAPATVLVFTSTECPISNQFAPELVRIRDEFKARGVSMWLVYPSHLDNVAKIRKHVQEYHYDLPALRDPEHMLVKRAEATVTPEAAVFDKDGSLAYAGRIDDRYVSLGRARPAPTRHDLESALSAVLAGHAVRPDRTRPVGCWIAD